MSWLRCFFHKVAFGVDKLGRPIHLQKSGLASHRFAQMYSFAGQNVSQLMATLKSQICLDVIH